jgi:hypothetical protein
VIDLDRQEVQTVDIELAGYRTERRELRDGEWTRAVLWREMSAGPHTWKLPLFLSPGNMLSPITENDGEMPSRIHARLVRDRAE